jgi:hypothetical protein
MPDLMSGIYIHWSSQTVDTLLEQRFNFGEYLRAVALPGIF